MAEAFARKLGADVIEAHSAGSRPSGKVNPKAVASMAEVGMDLANHSSKGLGQLPNTRWDWVVTMGCGDTCPSVAAENHEDWNLPDPKDLEPVAFAKVRDEIGGRVADLIGRCRADMNGSVE